MEFLDPRDVAVWSALVLFLAQLLADTFGLSAVGPRSDAGEELSMSSFSLKIVTFSVA